MPDSQLADEVLKKYPGIGRSLGWCGVISLILGSLATLLGQISVLRNHLFELFGPNHLLTIHFGMTFLVCAMFVVGYAALATWVYRPFAYVMAESLFAINQYSSSVNSDGKLRKR